MFPPTSLLTLPLLLLLTLHPPTTDAALRTPPSSFCKCICATNSTIIALNPSPPSTSTPQSSLSLRAPSHHKLGCADCTRSFCVSYNLPICKGVAEDQFSATCFQRDNLKDELVIYAFLAATVGLLGWAGLKPWVEKARERAGFGDGIGTGTGSARAENREGRYESLGEGIERSGDIR